MTSLSNTQPHFKPRAMQNTALSHHAAFKMFAAAVERGVRGEGERWLRKELSCVLIQWGCHKKSEKMCVFLLEANWSYCFTWCSQHVGVHPFNSVIFLRTPVLLGAQSLTTFFFFIKDFFFFFNVFIWRKKMFWPQVRQDWYPAGLPGS